METRVAAVQKIYFLWLSCQVVLYLETDGTEIAVQADGSEIAVRGNNLLSTAQKLKGLGLLCRG